MPKDVSIIIINFNTFDLTVECINSIINNTKCNYEILLVDNASTERNPMDFLLLFPFIKLIKSPNNIGFSKGNNLALQQSEGKYILLLNSDTLLLNNAIDLAYEKIKVSPEVGGLTIKLFNSDFSIQQSSMEFTGVQRRLFALIRAEKYFKFTSRIHKSVSNDEEHFTDWISGAFFLIPKQVINKFKDQKLQEDFFMYNEDVQWCYQIHKLGYKIMYYPKGYVLHYGGKSNFNPNLLPQVIAGNDYLLYRNIKGGIYSFFFCFVSALLFMSKKGEQNKRIGKAYINILSFIFLKK